jgi:hypothetical protein
MGYHLPIRERLFFVSWGTILVQFKREMNFFPRNKLNNTDMNSEEQKKKELEKRGEDSGNSGELGNSSMSKDQRKDAERVKESETDVQDSAQSTTEDYSSTRTTGTTPNDQAGVADIDRGMDRAKE